MPRSPVRILGSAIGTSLVVATIISFGAAPAAVGRARNAERQSAANPPVAFAHLESDLAVDPAARFGRLPNGMTYVIYKNKTPAGAASVWMRVAAGSVMEQENQRGLAHFLEHMAFNGSKNMPEGGMVKLLERHGLQFGADTNAYTGDTETVYMLNLPDAKPQVVGDALFLMRETAGNLLLNPKAIDRERGVILSEERSRASVGMRASEAELKFLFPGMKHPDRLPIGLIDVIKTAQRPTFARFYTDFYRPEYTTLIVVGDIEPDTIEADIKRRFSNWRPAPQSPAGRTDFGKLAPRTGPRAKVFVADGLPASISVSWPTPPVAVVETRARDLDDMLFALASTILNERYRRAIDAPGTAFLQASLQRQDIKQTARLYGLNIQPKEGQDRAAFTQGMIMLREFLANGPTQAELDRALLQVERYFGERQASARTVPTQAIAGQIVKALGERGVLQSPVQELAEIRELKPAITLSAVAAALKRSPLADPPMLWRQGEQAAAFDEASMLASYRSVTASPVQAFAARTIANWPYTHFGTATAIVARDVIPGVGATRVTFANGAILTVKQTDLEENTVNIVVQLGNGVLGVRPDQAAALFLARRIGLFAGGLGKLSADDITEALSGKVYDVSFGIGNTSASLSGVTTKTDMATQMQVLAAFLTDPGFRHEAFDRAKAELPLFYDGARTSPDGIYATKANGAVYDNDPRFSTPPREDALAVGQDQVTALLKEQLGRGPMEITIVGDISVDEAVKQVGATLGALPPLPAVTMQADTGAVRFPTQNLHRVYTHDGRADQNLSVIAWPTTDYFADPRRAAALDVLAAVMTIRELEEVREKQGATYSASVNNMMSRYFPGFGFMLSRATVRPDGDEVYYKTIEAIAADLKQKPVTTDELTRARAPLIQRVRSDRNSNGYWLSLLADSTRQPLRIDVAQGREGYLLSITPEDVKKQAEAYLDISKALHIQIKPKDRTPVVAVQ